MGSVGRLSGIQLLLVALVAFSSLNNPAAGEQLEVMSAPNLMRVGTAVNIFFEIQDCSRQDNINVPVLVKNHPTKTTTLASTSVTLTRAGKYQGFAKVKVSSEGFSTDPKVKQYVTLQAMFPGKTLEKVVLVSFQSGYIFIQTDKTIYTPSSNVRYRIFALTPGMEPVERGRATQTESSVIIEIMTPGDIVVKSDTVSLTSGIKSEIYELPAIVSEGQWKVVGKFQSNPQQSFFSEFEVKEYVLPSFEVKLSAGKPFFYVDSDALTIAIKATYVFGEEVDGTAYVVFGFIDAKSEKKVFPKSLQRVPVQKGRGQVTLNKEHITQTFSNINELVGNSIYVAVSVLTGSGGEMVEGELRGIKIVTSPYTISFKRTPKFFKPGMSFDVLVEVLNPDESPAPNIPVEVTPGDVKGTTAGTGLARLTVNTLADLKILEIRAKTKVEDLTENRQASAYMVAKPYETRSQSYLHISVETTAVEINQYIKVTFLLSKPEQNDITYLILSRGQLVKHFRYENNRQRQISQMVQFTKDMLPSFRIVAYYHTSSNELVSDSIWVDVQDICMGTLNLEVEGAAASYEPRKSFKLVITGDPGATVGLVAVDKSVYVLNNKHRLTQKKIWETVEKYEPGCTAGGGQNSMKVFYDAGLMLQTGSLSGTLDRTESGCPSSSRRKRASTIMDVRTSLLSEYQEKTEKECCLDGMRDVPVSYTCERRSEYIVDDSACSKAFLHCCLEMKKHQDENKEEVLQLARSEADDAYMDSDEIVSRTNFPESWHWTDIILGPCPENEKNCKTTKSEQFVALPDSITTWQLTGISLSRTHGICVADGLEVKVWKPFFIDLRLPYAAVRGEQLEIKAILHNYNFEEITVRVELKEEPGACSAAYKKGWFRQEVRVGARTTRSVPFIIIPMKDGEVRIEVKGVVKNSYHGDGVAKYLRVVPPGVLMKNSFNVTLDPAKKGQGGTQRETIRSAIPETDMIPNTPTNTLISLTGIEQLSSLFENSISGQSMGSLIKEPKGCGEQNMIGMTLPVIATIYLDKTNMWEDVGFEKRNTALKHIKTGYETQLKYRLNDGSFAIFPRRKPTTWLTAYVAKVFAMSYKLVVIDSNVICGAIKFLILNTQQPDGVFKEIGRVYEKHMIGDVGGVDSDASMTAFCLIAMQESQSLCSQTVNSLLNSRQKAVTYLERQITRLTNPYAVAMASYALANENKLNKQALYKFASQDRSHWPVRKGHIYTLEATAYALLALVKAQDFENAKNIVRWLSQQQKGGGGYGSTQATIMVYQAVAEYWTNAKEPQYSLDVDILLPGRSLVDKYKINRANHYQTRSSKFDGINKDVEVTAKGTGEAVFRMVSLYYAMPINQETGCEMFDLKLDLKPEKIEENQRIYKLTIEILYKNKDKSSSMTILDIGLPTGYTFNQNDLNALSSGKYPLISKYETDKLLSEKGSLMIYLNSVTNTRPEEVAFRIEQTMKVGVLQPAAVSVYEYYNRKHCVKYYRPERQSGELLRLCTRDECICAEENCSKQKKENIDNDQRTNKACESSSTSKIDFVYKVKVEDFSDGLNTDIYRMRVLHGIKVGSKDQAPLGQLRTFLSYQHCREALDLRVGKDFLIMGSSSDIHKDENNAYQYVLGENSWIEYWPTRIECQMYQHRPTCVGMEELQDQIETFGCQMK
ncbi:complement C3-like [Melanotaenia boesemani]|uniref:complement C3-like n=1 Tax=Melanotaenia boesemani TaxID=1250792 RepID=UPI001C046B09|nr:complement C3-like [Melanotaenia boesemani]